MSERQRLRDEFMDLFCGEVIGRGSARNVFIHAHDSSLVIKVEEKAQSFQNIIEWDTWESLKHAPAAAKWLAPCVAISPSGIILIQKRAYDLNDRKLPKKMPASLTDFKIQNYGIYQDRIVCRDYGTVKLNFATKLKKTEWW